MFAGPLKNAHKILRLGLLSSACVTLSLFGEIRASAQPTATPANATQVQSYEAGYFESHHPDTAYDMVLLLPGFALDPGLAVRGFEGAAGNVLIDGRLPVAKSDGIVEILKRLQARSVRRIDVIHGSAPGIDMHGHNIVANIVLLAAATTASLTTDATVSRRGRIGNTLRFDYERDRDDSKEELSLNLLHNQDRTDGSGRKILSDISGQPITSTLSSFIFPQNLASLHGSHEQALWAGLLRLNATVGYELHQGNENDFIVGASPARVDTVHASFRTLHGEVSADYSRSLADGVKLDTLLLQNLEQFLGRDTALQDNALSIDRSSGAQGESIARAALTDVIIPTLSLEAGGEVAYNFLNSDAALTVDGSPVPLPLANVRVAEIRIEPHATLTWKPNDAFNAELGVKFEASRLSVGGDAHHAVSLQFLKPRLFLTWNASEWDQLRVRLERTVGQLDFQSFVTSSALDTGIISAGNPELQPERDWTFELAWERKFWETGSAVVVLRRQDLQRVIDEAPVGEFTAPANIGAGFRNVAEVDVTVPLDRLGLDHALLKGSAIFLNSHVTDPTTRVRRIISNDEPYVFHLTLSGEVRTLNSTWQISAAGGNEFTGGFGYSVFQVNEIQKFHFDPQVDLQWEYRPTSDWSLTASAINVTSLQRTRERLIFPGARDVNAPSSMELRSIRDAPQLVLAVRRNL
jgi:outer membrane receptor protein involved in Fe transport